MLAIADRAAAILGFARGAIAALESALESAFELGERLIRRIGDQPGET